MTEIDLRSTAGGTPSSARRIRRCSRCCAAWGASACGSVPRRARPARRPSSSTVGSSPPTCCSPPRPSVTRSPRSRRSTSPPASTTRSRRPSSRPGPCSRVTRRVRWCWRRRRCSRRTPTPPRPRSVTRLSGILDRETAYVKVVEAVKRAAAALRGEKCRPMDPVVVDALAGYKASPAATVTEVDGEVSMAVPRLVISPTCPRPPSSASPRRRSTPCGW